MRDLGLSSPEQLLALRPSVLGYWAAMNSIDPSGPSRQELGNAVIASTIANVNRDSKKRLTPYAPFEFMPYYHKPAEDELTPAQIDARNKELHDKMMRQLGLDPDNLPPPVKRKRKK